MGKKRRILIAALIIVIFVMILWLGLSLRNQASLGNQLFLGKSEGVWIQNLTYRDEDQVKEWQAYGNDGVHVLLRGLDRANHPWERAYRKLWRRAPSFVRRVLPSPATDSTRATRMTIVNLLSRLNMNKDAMIAEPAMARELEDEDPSVRDIAITYFTGNEDQTAPLRSLDPKEKRRLLPVFINAMQDSKWSVRNNAAIALKYYPEESELVAPALVKALQDPALQVRKLATNYLKTIDPAAATKAGIK